VALESVANGKTSDFLEGLLYARKVKMTVNPVEELNVQDLLTEEEVEEEVEELVELVAEVAADLMTVAEKIFVEKMIEENADTKVEEEEIEVTEAETTDRPANVMTAIETENETVTEIVSETGEIATERKGEAIDKPNNLLSTQSNRGPKYVKLVYYNDLLLGLTKKFS